MRYLAAVTTEMSEELQSELTQMTEQISRTQEYLDRYLPDVYKRQFICYPAVFMR